MGYWGGKSIWGIGIVPPNRGSNPSLPGSEGFAIVMISKVGVFEALKY